ncbi:MAG: aspartyl protease family protein [Patescibacteria group bacterium]
MKFLYKKYGSRFRPVIPITLKNKERTLKYEALVDSGADICFFHSEVGEQLGLDVCKGKAEEVFGIGGKASVYYLHKITIEV